MKNAIDSVHDSFDCLWVEQIAFHEFNLIAKRIEVGEVARAEVVEDADLVVTAHERLGDVRSDETSSPGYQKRAHWLLPYLS
jgi:hypothetical protein